MKIKQFRSFEKTSPAKLVTVTLAVFLVVHLVVPALRAQTINDALALELSADSTVIRIVERPRVRATIINNSGRFVTLVQPGGTSEPVQRSEIQRLTPAPVSLMPVGLEEGLAPKDLADLIAWMKSE